MFATAIDRLLSLSPAPTGSQTIDRWSFEMLKVPSFFLYAANPLIDRAIVNVKGTVPAASERVELYPTASLRMSWAGPCTRQHNSAIGFHPPNFTESLVLRYREFNFTTGWRLLLKDFVGGEIIQVEEPLILIMPGSEEC
jgi:hypothetical protein